MSADREPEHPGADAPDLVRGLTRWLTGGLFAGLALVSAFPVYRAVESTRRAEAVQDREAALSSAGHELWTSACAECHGDNGEGVDAPALNSAGFFEASTRQQAHHVVQSGVPGTDMASWWNEFGGPFTDEQIDAVVAYMFSWKDKAPDRPDWRSPEGMEDGDHGHEGEGSEAPATSGKTVRITVTDTECGPLDLEVEAGNSFTIEFENQGSGSRSLDFQGVESHIHAQPGQVTPASVPALDAGEYRFQCLGTGHGTVLGSGVVTATAM